MKNKMLFAAACVMAFSTPTAFAQDPMSAWLDGRLTAEEYQALGRGRFAQADADRNGFVSASEFSALSLADFDRADRNKDGVIRRGEVRGLAPTADAAAIDSGFTRAQASELAGARFAQLDADANGALSQQEYLARLMAEFATGDVNQDGALTRGELRGLAAQQR